jgi:hypothetical protein
MKTVQQNGIDYLHEKRHQIYEKGAKGMDVKAQPKSTLILAQSFW